jgi:ATP/maltotriose-dependent transcriptional regulator MalT
LSRFLEYLVAALQRAEPSIARDVPALLKSSPVLPIDSVMTIIVNDLARCGKDVVLVLDDSHVLTSPGITGFLDALLTYAPPGFHLVLATRGEVPLKVANMRVRGQMVRIDDAGLRFSLAETRAFLNGLRGLALSEADVASLQYRTEGWIAALQLAALSLENRPDKSDFINSFSGTDRDIADFLIQDVLGRLPEPVIDFLLKTSVLDRMSAQLAEAVTGRSDAAALLGKVEQANLFVTRYRRLFAAALHERVRLLLQRGDAAAARLALKGRGIDEGWIASPRSWRPASEPEHIALARVLSAEGRPEAALRILERLTERLRREGRLHRFAQVRAVAAVAAYQSGDALSALAAIVDAVSLCAPQKAVRTLLDEGAPLLDVLAFGRGRIPSWKTGSELGQFVERLLSGHQRIEREEALARNRPKACHFSQREAELARLLSRGQSNRELAVALNMAPDTVKWHLKNIFGKLGVSNRTQAVLRLQEFGLTQSAPQASLPERVG